MIQVRGGFYKGMASPLIGQGIINFILFGVEGNVQKAYIEDRLPPTTYPVLSPFVSGSIAGISQSFVSCPMDLIKIRVQHQGIGEKREPRNLKSALFSTEDGRSQRSQKTYRGPLAMVKNIYRSEGLAGCYRGMVPTVWGDAIGFGIYFMTYENTRLLLQQSVFSGSEFFPSFIAGGLAGICTWSCSYPFDIMKARLQMDGVHAERQYKGMVDCFLKMRKEGGIRMLFKALTPTLLRAFVWSAAAFPAVEFVKLQFSMVDNSDKMHVGY